MLVLKIKAQKITLTCNTVSVQVDYKFDVGFPAVTYKVSTVIKILACNTYILDNGQSFAEYEFQCGGQYNATE